MKKSAVIVGAGISGLMLASKLLDNGLNVTILEKQNFAGGIATSIQQDNTIMDIGPHILLLPKNGKIHDEIIDFIGKENLIEVTKWPWAISFFEEKLFHKSYPLLYDIIINHGVCYFFKSIFDIIFLKIKNSIISQKHDNAEEYFIATYGNFLYTKWFKPFFAETCTDLKNEPVNLSIQIFHPITLKRIFVFIKKRFNTKKRSISSSEKFFKCYPKLGMKYFIKNITDNIEKKGGKIILNAEINSIKHHEKEKEISFIKNDDKNKIKPDIIVYSTPPSITLQWFEKIPIEIEIEAKKNRMFNSIMVFLVIDVPKLFDDWIITVYDTNLIIFRISQQSILSNEIVDKNKTLLCIEIRTIDGDNISKMSEVEIYQKIESDLTKMSILKNERIIKRKLIKIKHIYPIKSAENQNLDKIFDFITSFKNEYMINTIVDTGKLAATRREDENSNVDPDATGIYKAILNAEALTKKIILE
jgi:protoporphyrinogen oxidase